MCNAASRLPLLYFIFAANIFYFRIRILRYKRDDKGKDRRRTYERDVYSGIININLLQVFYMKIAVDLKEEGKEVVITPTGYDTLLYKDEGLVVFLDSLEVQHINAYAHQYIKYMD